MSDFDLRVKRTQAFKAFQKGDFRKAYQIGAALVKNKGSDLPLWELIGVSAARIGRAAQAEKYLLKVLKFRGKKPSLHLVLGELYSQQGRLDESLERFDRALAVEPALSGAIAGKAAVLERRGENDAARTVIQPYVDAGTEDAQMAAVFATIEQSDGRHEQSIDLIKRHLALPSTDMHARSTLCSLIARAYEKTEDYAKAFEAFTVSNRVIAHPFDAKAYVEAVDTLIAVFSRQNLAQLPRASKRSELPLFIASMPRSGSTLVEQILHAHPRVYGAGEITELAEMVRDLPRHLESIQPYPECLADFTQDHADLLCDGYLVDLRSHDPDANRIANKHLDNYMHLGMVQLLFPGSRVVHCKRHPLDNCFSIFMAAMNTEMYPWATDLADLGLAYRQYERLMSHWHDVLDLEILDIQYEDLVADTDKWTRRIIEFCDLPWDDACLHYYEADRDVLTLSYDQVRRPIYKSAVKRYKKFEEHLGPLKDALSIGRS